MNLIYILYIEKSVTSDTATHCTPLVCTLQTLCLHLVNIGFGVRKAYVWLA